MTRTSVVALVFGLIGLAGPASGQPATGPDASSLEAIGPLRVETLVHVPGILQPADPEWRQVVQGLQTFVEDRLRQDDIPLHEDARSTLRITVVGSQTQAGASRDPSAVLVEVSLTQLARLNSGVATLARTWERQRVYVVADLQQLLDAAQVAVRRFANEFSSDYLAVNRSG